MIRWEKDPNVEQSVEHLNECHVRHSDAENDKTGEYLYSPAQVLCFTSPTIGVSHAIVKCCEYEFERGSVISTIWKQEYSFSESGIKIPRICHVDVNCIISHVIMIPTNKDDGIYHQICHKRHWANEFCVH